MLFFLLSMEVFAAIPDIGGVLPSLARHAEQAS